MTTIAEKARQAQKDALERMGAPAEAIDVTTALYEAVDDLTDSQRLMLVREALIKASSLANALEDQAGPNNPTAVALSMMAHAVLAMGGYAIDQYRENIGETGTGDAKVDAAIEAVRQALANFALGGMNSDEQARAKEISEKVQARIAKGEDFNSAMQAEIAAHAAAHPDMKPLEAPAASETTEKGSPSRYNDDGMYL